MDEPPDPKGKRKKRVIDDGTSDGNGNKRARKKATDGDGAGPSAPKRARKKAVAADGDKAGPLRKKASSVRAFVDQHVPRLKEQYSNAHRIIKWSDPQVRRHFAVRDGLIEASELQFSVSKEWLIMVLSDHLEGDFWKTMNFNCMLERAVELCLISESDKQDAWTSKKTVAKCYLWTLVDSQQATLRAKLKEYAVVCSELMIRGSLLANMVATYAIEHGRTDELFALMAKERDCIGQLLLPELLAEDKRAPLVRDVMNVCRDDMLPCPQWEQVMGRAGWDNAIKFLCTKYGSAVARHVYVHMAARCSKYMDTFCTSPASCKALFFQGRTEDTIDDQDAHIVARLRAYFGTSTGEWTAPKTLTRQLFDLHILFLTSDIKKVSGSILPVSKWTRAYHRIDDRIFENLAKAAKVDVAFDDIFGNSIVRQKLKESRKKKRNAVRKRLKGRAKKSHRRRVQRSAYKFHAESFISSVETDGVGASLVVKTPMQARTMHAFDDSAGAKAREAQRALASFCKEYGTEWESLILAGIDWGRRNFYTIKFRTPAGVESTIPDLQFTRAQWLRTIRDSDRKRFYKDKDAVPCVRQFLTAVSGTSKKDATFAGFREYARTVCNHRDTLQAHFLQDDDRCRMAMKCFRRRRAAMHDLCNRVFRHVWKHVPKCTPLVMGGGSGSFGGRGGRGEVSVPVKEMIRYMEASLERLGQRGRLWKRLDEFYTTKMCFEHQSKSEDHHQKNRRGHAKKRTNINVRCCPHCATDDNKLGLIDRDGNAAANILLLLETLLRDGPNARPRYLRRPPKKARNGATTLASLRR